MTPHQLQTFPDYVESKVSLLYDLKIYMVCDLVSIG